MKLKIRQPETGRSVEIKQLPSKQIYLITLKQQSKNHIIPINIGVLPYIRSPEGPTESFLFSLGDKNEYLYDSVIKKNIDQDTLVSQKAEQEWAEYQEDERTRIDEEYGGVAE